MDKVKVLNLAKLARIKLSDAEADTLSHEFAAILDYVGQVKSVSDKTLANFDAANFPIRNVMREDGKGHESGIYTEKILSQAPAREGNYLKVKKIL